MPVDTGGLETLSFQPVWTPVDTHGRRLEIYGSERMGPCRKRQGRVLPGVLRKAPPHTGVLHLPAVLSNTELQPRSLWSPAPLTAAQEAGEELMDQFGGTWSFAEGTGDYSAGEGSGGIRTSPRPAGRFRRRGPGRLRWYAACPTS